MRQEQKIREAIQKAKSENIKIVYGPAFIWSNLEKPEACNAIGAILLFLNNKEKSKNPWKIVCDHLGIKAFWLYRFHIGFDRNHQIMVASEK